MNGIILIDKDKGFTSHDVVAKMRGILRMKKIGHSGTLDPEATGLLVVGVGQGTKIMKFLNQDEKIYQATAKIGEETDTLDDDGVCIDKKALDAIPNNIADIVDSFQGEYTFEIPMYSAVKVKGKKLYEYARAGEKPDVDLSKTVEIYNINMINQPRLVDQTILLDYQVHASKGLYVRALSKDIGRKLGYPAYNLHLRRIKAGQFDIKDAQTLDQLQDQPPHIITLANALPFTQVIASNEQIQNIRHGRTINLDSSDEHISLIDEKGHLLAIYKQKDKQTYQAVNVFLEGETK